MRSNREIGSLRTNPVLLPYKGQSLIIVLSLLIDQATRHYYIHDVSEGHLTILKR